MKISITATYRSIGAIIHQPLSPDGVHPQISSSLRLLVFALFVRACSSYCLFIFSKELISFNGSLDKCRTSVLIFPFLVHHLLLRLHRLLFLQSYPKQALDFYASVVKSFENTVGKGEIDRLFPQCFLSFWRTSCHFQQIQNCHL